MKNLELFTNLYQQSKTLRFELIPVGETFENIQKSGIFDRDSRRAENYRKMKKTIDEFHKDFIDHALAGTSLTNLDTFAELYSASAEEKRTEKWRKSFDLCRRELRKEIVTHFKQQEGFSDLNKKELIRNRLKTWIDKNRPDLFYSKEFNDFTTYFTGYNQNRMNMYSDEDKATSVSYRIVNENLPKFLDNIVAFRKIRESQVSTQFSQLCTDMEPWINAASLDEVFSVNYYSNVLTQKQIDAYNVLLGGRREGDHKLQGLNEYINLYNQTHADAKLPRMKMLYKQILSDRESISWLPEEFRSAAELLDTVSGFSKEVTFIAARAKKAIQELPSCDLTRVYVKGDALGGISSKLFGAYYVFSDALNTEKLDDFYSIDYLQTALNSYEKTVDKTVIPDKESLSPDCLIDYFEDGFTMLTAKLQGALDEADALLNTHHPEDSSLSQSDKTELKAYLDAAMEMLHFLKPLYLPSDSELEKDDLFYGIFAPVYEELKPMTKLYDMVRNFATKKPYSTEKMKLNFDCSTLLDGWDVSKETQNLGVLLIRNGEYYLGIMDKRHNYVMKETPTSQEANCYIKVQYKLLPGPNKMLPKVFFSKTRIAEFAPSEEVMRIYQSGSFKKGAEFSLEDCHKLIDFYKASIQKHTEWSRFGFCFSPTDSYQDIAGFYREISEQGYRLTYTSVSAEYIDALVRDGKLYLFRIYNKDFSPYSKGRPNLHTMYWKALFSDKNLNNVVYKLNGKAEIFYRKRSIDNENIVVHPAGQPIAKKNPALAGESSTFSYQITKDRRYTLDKFQLHVPITINFKASGSVHINQKVCEYIKNNPDVNIIGIDRGERHLLYISLIDRNGRVVQDENGRDIQYSLNTVTGNYRSPDGRIIPFETPYRELLDKKEGERQTARQNWETVENIKELKEGYLSQIVHHIARLMVRYNAIAFMEDLNSGFKRGRIKVEKQVYQKFEKALIEKLNYLVFKDVEENQPGGLYSALQLTDKFESFNKLTKQSGFLFYVPAWNTSKIDPVTGFTDLLKPKYTNVAAAKTFIKKFSDIYYDAKNDWFCFRFDYRDFTEKAGESRTKWELCTFGKERYAFNRNMNGSHGGYEKWDVNARLKKLFEDYGIDYSQGNLKDAIEVRTEAPFFASLIKNLQVLLALRYSSVEDKKDFILSPVAGPDGTFFCSENHKPGLPADADANGAFNIARKGLWVLRQIDSAENYTDWTTKVQNTQWLSFVQELRP